MSGAAQVQVLAHRLTRCDVAVARSRENVASPDPRMPAHRNPRVQLWRISSGLVLIIALSSCVRAPKPAEYDVSGQILDIRHDTGVVLLKHGDIKGFMPAMTMAFPVKDRSLLDGKRAGDLVSARLMVADADVWLATLTRTGSAALPPDAADAAARLARAPLAPGAAAPADVALVDESGGRLTLDSWRGSAVAITFIYTQCPLPQYCPLMDRRFSELQRVITQDPALARQARLLSVSFDPETDRPAVLRAHAAKLGADPAIWRFATAPREEVDRFAGAFGVTVMREADRTITHNLRTAVIGPTGHIVSIYDGNEWTVEQLAGDMRRALAR